MEFAPPPECPKCKVECDNVCMEAIVAPGVPTLALSAREAKAEIERLKK